MIPLDAAYWRVNPCVVIFCLTITAYYRRWESFRTILPPWYLRLMIINVVLYCNEIHICNNLHKINELGSIFGIEDAKIIFNHEITNYENKICLQQLYAHNLDIISLVTRAFSLYFICLSISINMLFKSTFAIKYLIELFHYFVPFPCDELLGGLLGFTMWLIKYSTLIEIIIRI